MESVWLISLLPYISYFYLSNKNIDCKSQSNNWSELLKVAHVPVPSFCVNVNVELYAFTIWCLFSPAVDTEQGCREKKWWGGTLREVRPCFVDPHPPTPQVLWHWLYECACRIQTRQLSVCLSMSQKAESICWDKAEPIVLSSASQRESFLPDPGCAPYCTSHQSVTMDPRDISFFAP